MATLARRGQAPVSTDQGLTLSQQTGCLLYIESSSRNSLKSVISAFEVAALAKFGHLSTTPRNISMSLMSLGGPRYMPPPVPPKPYVGGLQHPSFNRISPPVPPKPRRAMSTMALNHQPPMHNSMLEKENFNYVSQNHLDQSDSIIVHQGMFLNFLVPIAHFILKWDFTWTFSALYSKRNKSFKFSASPAFCIFDKSKSTAWQFCILIG